MGESLVCIPLGMHTGHHRQTESCKPMAKMAKDAPMPHPQAEFLTTQNLVAWEKKFLLSTSGETYQPAGKAKNPFLRRTVAKNPGKKSHVRLGQNKGGWLTNVQTDPAFLRRASSSKQPSTPVTNKNTPAPNKTFLQAHVFEALPLPQHLVGNPRLLDLWIERFFTHVLQALRRDPWQFDAVVEALIQLLVHEKLTTPLHRIHLTLQNWDDLMATLLEISRYPAPETFPMFCSALLAYYVLVHPEQWPA